MSSPKDAELTAAFGMLQDLDRSSGHGLVYLQRPIGAGAKAGNLNHALQHASGEVILVLDAGRLLCTQPYNSRAFFQISVC